jgi:hypothetical protein
MKGYRMASASDHDPGSKCKGKRRSKTIPRKQMMRDRKKMQVDPKLLELADQARPKTRSECLCMERPCLFVSCKHHLYLDVNPETGSIKLNFPDKEVWQLSETCALDVAARGGLTLEEVGEILNLTRERIRQLEAAGLQRLFEQTGDNELKDLLS